MNEYIKTYMEEIKKEDVNVDVLEKMEREFKEKYGYSLLTTALNSHLTTEEEITKIVWFAACCGNTKLLQHYFTHGGKTNRRYIAFGRANSLIAGAFRNNKMETVQYLYSVGEEVEEHERLEMENYRLKTFFLNALSIIYNKLDNPVEVFKNDLKMTDREIEVYIKRI